MLISITYGFLAESLVLAGCIFLAGSIGLFYIGGPLWAWSLLLIGLSWVVGLPIIGIYGLIGLLCFFGVSIVRKHTVSKFVLTVLRKLNIFPSVSETERIALESGSVWVDKILFSGSPSIRSMMAEPYPSLNAEEQSFLKGPVEKLCAEVDDWEISQIKDLPESVWKLIKEAGFLGMIIPKKYGGLELSPLAHSAVISKLASRSSALAITVMVPNSLGPAELLMHYGTEAQKDYYLPRLASGKEIPCFALTEPTAGSDAGAMQANGVVFKDSEGNLKIRLKWTKRWITLSGISTVIGLAFKLEDPDHLLGDTVFIGITCALIPRDTPGVRLETRHDPMGIPFWNCPVFGENVEVPIDAIIGGRSQAGKGWQLLMDSLAAGRGISLPALSTGVVKLAARVCGDFSVVRKQFGMSIGKFEGVQEPLARLAGKAYLMDAARIYTCGALARGQKPAVITAIMKYHMTELARGCINDGMDIMGGAGISLGPRNLLANSYIGTPIGITVEGANILTRTMIIFGQGALRCHPFAYPVMKASQENNLVAFDTYFWGHLGHIAKNVVRAFVLSITRGWSSGRAIGPLSRYKRKVMWASASYAVITDIAMGIYGGKLKMKESLTGRLADILSWMFLASSVLRRFEAEGERKEDLAYAQWALSYAFKQIDDAFNGVYRNMGGVFKWVMGTWSRCNPMSYGPSDKLGSKIASSLMTASVQRNRLTEGLYIPIDTQQALGRFEQAFQLTLNSDAIAKKVSQAIQKKQIQKGSFSQIIKAAVKIQIINESEATQLKIAEKARLDAIQVDAFSF